MKNIEKDKKYIPVDLNDKVEEFLNWYQINMVKCHSSDHDIQSYYAHQQAEKVRNLIDTIAIWYKLRYSDDTIWRIRDMKSSFKYENIMFEDNGYINALFDKNDDVRSLDWCEFYNPQVFFKSLPWEERKMISEVEYYASHFEVDDYLTVILTPNREGTVKKVEVITSDLAPAFEVTGDYIIKGDLKAEELIGLTFKEALELFKKRDIKLPKNNQLARDVKYYDNAIKLREGILNCAMYKIIVLGGKSIGPYRAFLFAKEFGRNIDIPMMYGVDSTDHNLRNFVIEYLKAGGHKDLECYEDYFSRKTGYTPVSMVSIQELLLTEPHDSKKFYTPEETELHQRLVDAISRKKLTL